MLRDFISRNSVHSAKQVGYCKLQTPQNRKTNFCWTYWYSIKYIDRECYTEVSNVFIRTNTADLNHIWQHMDQLICMLDIVIPSRSHKLLDLCPSTHVPWPTYLECTCYATSCTYVYFVQCPFCIESRMWLCLKIFKKGVIEIVTQRSWVLGRRTYIDVAEITSRYVSACLAMAENPAQISTLTEHQNKSS